MILLKEVFDKLPEKVRKLITEENEKYWVNRKGNINPYITNMGYYHEYLGYNVYYEFCKNIETLEDVKLITQIDIPKLLKLEKENEELYKLKKEYDNLKKSIEVIKDQFNKG
ncbi:MAG TPA: hypothetical protein VI911_09435 [Patescibacteria group bacterium]|nr:MAG: hypothetical protein UR43_C0005G0131 [candidate division TM6 bacterium GW2011_GWF2_33_332]HLD91220.1 hypothetical protein [Patescibacteria group bacterium]